MCLTLWIVTLFPCLKKHRNANTVLPLLPSPPQESETSLEVRKLFQESLVLLCLFDVTPLSTDEGVLLRRMCMEMGVVHLILACLSVLGHHPSRQFIPGIYQEILKVAYQSHKRQQPSSSSSTTAPSVPNYWAKGTGFGTGSTDSKWDNKQLLAQQRCEEEHVTSLLLVLASFIGPKTSSVSTCSITNNLKSLLSVRTNLLKSFIKTESSFSNQSSAAGEGSNENSNRSSNENSNENSNRSSNENSNKNSNRSSNKNNNRSSSEISNKNLPVGLPALLSQSCLMPAILFYLRNDSVLDILRRIPLYRALLQVLQSIASCQSLISLLLPPPDNNGDDKLASSSSSSSSSISSLLDRMKKCIETYTLKLKGNNKGKEKAAQKTTAASSASNSVASSAPEVCELKGLAFFISEIQVTSTIVNRAIADYLGTSGTQALTIHKKKDTKPSSSSSSMMAAKSSGMCRMSQSQKEKYISVMKLLQYDTYKMLSESNDILIFTLPHHYESKIMAACDMNNPMRARRLAQETVMLSTSLPLSVNSSIFVRCDEERLDVMKVMITGQTDTPYSNGCFEFDVFFPVNYPNSPPLINLVTTGGNSVRFNPNLYSNGKVCLSIINTWQGRPEERWQSQTSTFLQILVSIQSLILVCEPWFNEPGYEKSLGTKSGTDSSRKYDAYIRQATVRWAILEMIRNPPLAFKQIIQWHFWLKKDEIVSQIESWIRETEKYSKDQKIGKYISNCLLSLKRNLALLKKEFAKMNIPEDVQPDDDDGDYTDNNNSDDNDYSDDDNDNGMNSKAPK